ncbi:MAG: AAA family ATPase [Desulfovibrio sp.]|uniref:AAA family ATPase n=1 Tax=Desulfovibrio sp. 7SRBS1 TaxID=3378064 RepID=UPI003B3CCADB
MTHTSTNSASQCYYWEADHLFAIQAAIEVGRPLLVRGEPGIGKSTLARAAAERLGRYFVSEVVTARTEPNDLLWQFDGVKRLADAQLKCTAGGNKITLDKRDYIAPGALWWVFQPEWAKAQHSICPGSCCPSFDDMKDIIAAQLDEHTGLPKKNTSGNETTSENGKNGWVLLIDEIDKADSDVPNSLLEAFAENEFAVPHFAEPVCRAGGAGQSCNASKPLVVITTNEDRELPAAFLRRCFVLNMEFPKDEDAPEWLLARAEKHGLSVSSDILVKIAKLLLKERREKNGIHCPGLGEYLDFAYAFEHMRQNLPKLSDEDLLKKISSFALKKNARNV